MIMSRDQYARQNHEIKLDNALFQTVSQLSYMQTAAADTNCVHEECKSRKFCPILVQNVLFSILVSNNLKIKIY